MLQVAEELDANRDEIIGIWEARVRELVKSSQDQTSIVLRNTLPKFLDELISVLKRNPSPNEELIHIGMASFHGGQRATLAGYHLPQLLKEFSILRQLINETLHKKGILTYEVRSFIDKTIDTVISSAATEFARTQHAETQAALLRSEASNLDLERFAAVAAHDLKSPLSTISGYLSVLDEEFTEKLGEEGLQFVRLMIQASQRMRNLIDSLLDYARLTSTKKPFQRINLNDIAKAALENLNQEIRKTKAAITTSNFPYLMGDPDLLTQLFQNLIANSIKFRGNEPPRISVNSELKGDVYLFTLKDNGIGFDPKQREEIFALYKKLHGESEYQGVGIGLAAARKVVELHGGRIWADSIPGVGSTFCFTLSAAQDERGSFH